MKIFALIGIVVCILFVLNLILENRRIGYAVQLFVKNRRGELLLIYDGKQSRFTVPCRKVLFNETPTKTVNTLMNEVLPGQEWDFDYEYHLPDNKYDRVRDDIGPVRIYDQVGKIGKKCVLCYVLCVEQFKSSYSFKKEYPFLEFYSTEEIDAMSEEICPPKVVLTTIRKL